MTLSTCSRTLVSASLAAAGLLAAGSALAVVAGPPQTTVYFTGECSDCTLLSPPEIGTLVLEQIGLLSFRLQWNIGPDVIEGVGMVSGLSFATAFSLGSNPSMGIYELRPNGDLVGQWTTIGAFAAGQETAKPR